MIEIQEHTIDLLIKSSRKCIRCRRYKPEWMFVGPDGLVAGGCTECREKRMLEYYNNREHNLEVGKQYSKKNVDKIQKNARISAKYIRLRVLEHYGKYCECCGEDQIEFLAVDHINGFPEGKKRTGARLWRWLIKNLFPKGFRTLCCNCNFGRYVNGGECPHQTRIRNE